MCNSSKLARAFVAVVLTSSIFRGCAVNNQETAYVIRRVGTEMKVDGDVNKDQWQLAKDIRITINTFGQEKKYQSPTIALVSLS